MAGAGFRGPLLICLLNLTLTVKSASHTSQFVLKEYVFVFCIDYVFDPEFALRVNLRRHDTLTETAIYVMPIFC